MICITYCPQFLDKLYLNYASTYDLIPDLGLERHRYSWVAAIFNSGYLSRAVTANLMIQRLPIAEYTGTMIFLWNAVLCCHATANYSPLTCYFEDESSCEQLFSRFRHGLENDVDSGSAMQTGRH